MSSIICANLYLDMTPLTLADRYERSRDVGSAKHRLQVKLLVEQSSLQKVESERKGSGDQFFPSAILYRFGFVKTI